MTTSRSSQSTWA